MKTYWVVFLPNHRKIEVAAGTNLLDAAISAGVELNSLCGGKGKCGKCRIHLEETGMPDFSRKKEGVLACQTEVQSDLIVHIPPVDLLIERKGDSRLSGLLGNIRLDPGLKKVCVKVKEPSLNCPLADWTRLSGELKRHMNDDQAESGIVYMADVSELNIHLEALRKLPKALRERDHTTTVVMDKNSVISVESGDTTEALYGVAVDLGTTTIAASLIDLNTGKRLHTASAANSQNAYGADVISRIAFCAENQSGLEILHGKAVEVLNSLIEQLCRFAGVDSNNLYQLTVVGNPTMTHLLAKLDPTNLAIAPFTPVISGRLSLEARDLALNAAAHTRVHFLPNIAGYLGSDTVGVILSTNLDIGYGTKLAVDIGTNGEIVLCSRGELIACSAAAGPAFEGAQIEFGMRATEGAIEAVEVTEDVKLKTIGGHKPKGICGSGLIDAVAAMLEAGIIDSRGKLLSSKDAGELPHHLQRRFEEGESGMHFILAFEEETALDGPVFLSQKDIEELRLAKAAINAGIRILMAELGITSADLQRVFLAGAFGSYINKESALSIGLIPPVQLNVIESVGNAAGVGAQVALLSEGILDRADKIARKVKAIELATHKDFEDYFIGSLGDIGYFQGTQREF